MIWPWHYWISLKVHVIARQHGHNDVVYPLTKLDWVLYHSWDMNLSFSQYGGRRHLGFLNCRSFITFWMVILISTSYPIPFRRYGFSKIKDGGCRHTDFRRNKPAGFYGQIAPPVPNAPSSECPQFGMPELRSQHDAAPLVQLQYLGERRAAAAMPVPVSP